MIIGFPKNVDSPAAPRSRSSCSLLRMEAEIGRAAMAQSHVLGRSILRHFAILKTVGERRRKTAFGSATQSHTREIASALFAKGLRRGAHKMPIPRFCRAFRSVNIAINHLKVRQSPKVEQSRPRRVSVFAPDPEQRDAMVDFGIPPQPPAALSAAPTLDTTQQSDLATRRIPELPSNHASAVPDGVLVGSGSPKVNVPAEAVDRLTAHAAKSWPQGVRVFTERHGWCAERERQAVPAVPQPPRPSSGRLAATRKCPRQAIGSNWMDAPVRLDGKPRRRRHKRAVKSTGQYGSWKYWR